ncbi:protein of unknown function [Caballeronia sp. S22]
MPSGRPKCRCTAVDDHSPVQRSIFTKFVKKQRANVTLIMQCKKKGPHEPVIADIARTLPRNATMPRRNYSYIDKDHSTETRMIFGRLVFTLRSQAA